MGLTPGAFVAETVFTKCAWRLTPFITLLYVVGFIDRSERRDIAAPQT